MSAVAVIGLGRMGGPMADNLIAAGHDVRVFDVSAAAVDARVALGATAAPSAAAAAAGADVVCVVVFDGRQVLDVLTGPAGVLGAAAPGTVVSIHTTTSIDVIEEAAVAAEHVGVHVIDAGVTGGEPGAHAGTLLTMVGGTTEAVDAARAVLLGFSREVVHAGPLGAGMTLKLARNMVGYVMMRAVHEALLLTRAGDIDAATLRHVLVESDLPTQYLAPIGFGGPTPVDTDAPAEQRSFLEHTCRLGDKDLDEALAVAGRLDVDLEVAALTRQHFHEVLRLREPPS